MDKLKDKKNKPILNKKIIIEFEGSEILERKASKFGTGAHIILPKHHEGKKIKLIIGKEDD